MSLLGWTPAVANDADAWAKFRGPAATGDAPVADLPSGEYGLSVRWTADIGSGYSNVSYADGRVFTLFTRDANDVMAAFDAENGEELWSYTFGPKYVGHDGSEDGPLSTPTIVGDVVFAVSAQGQAVALSVETGERVWGYDLDEQNSNVPHYGYTTSPLVSGDTVILATGGEGHAITGLDRFTGEPKWGVGDDTVHYQTPSLVTLGGREVLVAVTDQYLYGIEPASGDLLWDFRHSEGQQLETEAHIVPIDGDRFVVGFGRGARMYSATASGVEEVWASRAFSSTLSIPVLYDGHLYGFTRSILTCANAATGEIVWRSREPGGQGLSLIGDVLATVEDEGHLVLVEPTPEEYREITRVKALDRASTHQPSFAGDAFIVRNMTQMAAVVADVNLSPTGAPVRTTERLRGAFGEWIGSLESMPRGRRQAAVDRYFETVESTPITESTGGDTALAHFVWRGDAEDVGVGGSVVGGQDVGLERVEGTDLFFTSLELVAAAQYPYNFIVDYGDQTTDPMNPHSSDLGNFVVSEARMPDWPASPHLDEPAADAARGSLDTFPFRSEIMDNTRQIQVWRPPGYGSADLPLLVVNHGDNVLRGGLMRNTLDNLVGQSVAPIVVVFVPRVAPPEYGGPNAELYTRFVVRELLPHLERHYRVRGTPRAVMGSGSAAVASLLATLRHPEIFSGVALQSFYPIEPTQPLFEGLISGEGGKPEQAIVVYSNRDYDLGNGVVAKDASQEVLGWLRDAGVETQEIVSEYTPDWAGWRGQHDDILQTLFPLEN
ncbi:MAG: PQQ-binding-like beta-propeller repeat protein [Acidobacteriota bacterium]